ncbi:MAG TPA: glycosyltransferase family 2 protein [Bryobacteraceae bacterium]|nr:glycosyltransferase family 2 protein [Bryobacteraceae bacterium]
MNDPAVTIVIPVWNGRARLERLLEKLSGQTYPIVEVLAVDNGSTDGAADAAARSGARVLRMGSNLGFSRAVNAGIEACRTELVALVNSDVEPDPRWLGCLVQGLHPGAWFATGKILSLSRRDRIDGTYDLLSFAGCAWRKGQGRPDGPEFSRPQAIRMAPGTAALFRRELFERAGRFDDAFESYMEDVDFGLRCALLGLEGVYVPEALAWHEGSASLGAWSGSMVRRIARNQVLLISRHYPPKVIRRYWWSILVGQCLWGVLAARHGAGCSFVKGKWAGLRAFRSMRRSGSEDPLARILRDCEREIAGTQRRTGFDWYWKVYFLLTSGGLD